MQPHRLTRNPVVALLVWFTSSLGRAHSVPTHKIITNAAVAWLLQAQPRLQCSADGAKALTNALLWGTEHEDDYLDPAAPIKMGRFQFHFRPALDDSFAKIEIGSPSIDGIRIVLATLDLGVFKALNSCSSLEWGGFARNTPGNVTCSYDAGVALPPATAGTPRVLTPYAITNVNTWGNAVADAGKSNSLYSGFSEGFVKLGT